MRAKKNEKYSDYPHAPKNRGNSDNTEKYAIIITNLAFLILCVGVMCILRPWSNQIFEKGSIVDQSCYKGIFLWVRPFFIIKRRKRNKFKEVFYAHTRMYFHSNEIVFLFLQLSLYFRLQKWNIGNPKTTPLWTRIKIHFDCTYFYRYFFSAILFNEIFFQHTSERRKRGENFRYFSSLLFLVC